MRPDQAEVSRTECAFPAQQELTCEVVDGVFSLSVRESTDPMRVSPSLQWA